MECEDQPDSSSGGRDQGGTKRTRTRSGCLNCRRKRRKCDEGKPSCGSCAKKKEVCEWGLRLTFRAEHAQTIRNNHPSMKAGKYTRWPRRFEIVDLTTEVMQEYHQSTSLCTPGSPGNGRQSLDSPMSIADSTIHIFESDELWQTQNPEAPQGLMSPQAIHFTDMGLTNQLLGETRQELEPPNTAQSSIESSKESDLASTLLNSTLSPTTATTDSHDTPISQAQRESAAAHLLQLRQDLSYRQSLNMMPAEMDPVNVLASPSTADYMNQVLSPEGTGDDGIFLPGSAYHELYSTLRSHLMQVRSDAPTRRTSPVASDGSSWQVDSQPANRLVQIQGEIPMPEVSLSEDRSPPSLSGEEECKLWKNYLEEISPWLDKFDSKRHFQETIPIMARSYKHLKYSILALSARQLERKDGTRPLNQSLMLYQEAIHYLLPQLHTRSTAVIASSVILCVLEMLSCSPKAWRRHLDGCASLLEAVDINGFVGGLEQALFWCFARMDIWGGFISSKGTLIPVNHWASKIDLDADVGLFRATSSPDTYANHAIYLCAQALDLVSPCSNNLGGRSFLGARTDDQWFRERWMKLWRYIEDWQNRRPEKMRPVMSFPQTESNPFPTVLYSNPAAMSGNQFYHTTAILMLQHKPHSFQLAPKPRSILWHARQICAISLSNDHHGMLTNSIQPLWIAGQWMSHPSEHKAILEVLDRIEKDCGWGTQWRADDLKEFWGDLGDCA